MLIDVYGQGKRFYCCTDAYKPVDNPSEWLACPECGLKPLIWEFDNGRYTACGCGESSYDHFSIRAESINSYTQRWGTYKSSVYNDWYDEYEYELQDNWNTYCETGDDGVFDRKKAALIEEQDTFIF